MTVVVGGEVKTPADVPGVDIERDTPELDGGCRHIRARAEHRPNKQVPTRIILHPPERVLADAGGCLGINAG